MARGTERTRTSPLVLLSFCLSVLAVALSATALLMVYDKTHGTWKTPKKGLGVQRVEWNWSARFERIEERFNNLRTRLVGGEKEDQASAITEVDSVLRELRAWTKAAGPRLEDAATSLAKQAEQLSVAVREGSEAAAERLEALWASVRGFRRHVEKKPSADSDEEEP